MSEIINLSKNLSLFLWDDISFNLNLFISSITSESGSPIYFLRILFFKSFRWISISISSIVSSIIFIACLKTLLWIKAFWLIFECVENDFSLYFLLVCDISFCTFESFCYNFYEFSHSADMKRITMKKFVR